MSRGRSSQLDSSALPEAAITFSLDDGVMNEDVVTAVVAGMKLGPLSGKDTSR
jgi:hypothetical protein